MDRREPVVQLLEARTLFAVTTFTIDPALSSLRLSGEVAGAFDIESQAAGSLVQNYQGSIVADVTGAVISFPGNSSIVAQATKEYDPGDGPANYGVEGEAEGPFDIKVGEGAIRNFAFDLRAGDLALTDAGAFDASALDVRTTNGVLEFDLRVGGDGEQDLDDEDADNDAPGNATLRGTGDNRTLTIPLDFIVEAGSTDLRLRGTLVAKTGTGAPVDPNVVRIGEGTLNKAVQFTDADGTVATVTLAGGGSADVRFANATQAAAGAKAGTVVVSGSGVQFLGVDATGTSSSTKLAITGKGGADGLVNIPSLTTDGPVGTVGGKGTAFVGAVTVDGNLTTLTASRLTSANVSADTTGTIKVTGDVSGTTITVNSLRNLAVSGAFATSRVSSAGPIGVVKARSMTGSEIFSDVNAATRFPTTTEITDAGSIGSVTVKTFADSVIAADTLGRLKLGTVTTANAGAPFGITADFLGSLQVANESKEKLRLLLVDSQSTLDAQLDLQSFDEGDLTFRIA